MSWVVFTVGAWIMLGCELGLKDSLGLGSSGIAPSFLAIYAVYIACSAPPRAAQWACLILGALADLTTPQAHLATGSNFFCLGPNALGALLACQFVLAVRGLMFRRNPLTLGFLACVGFGLWQIVATAIFSVRHVTMHATDWSPSHELWVRIASALYTGVAAVPVSLLLILLMPLFAFQYTPHRFSQKR